MLSARHGILGNAQVAPRDVPDMTDRPARVVDATGTELFTLLYDELRRIAAAALRRERAEHTLQPTALVHEVYVRLSGTSPGQWQDRAHFIAMAARAMRRVLVDHARARNAVKRGQGGILVSLDGIDVPAATSAADLVVLDATLERLAALDERQARIVELRFFGGLTVEETAAVLEISPRTVKREWQMARAWLQRELEHQRDIAPPGGEGIDD